MPVWDIYSKRRNQMPDVYQFTTLPEQLREQIQRIIRNVFTSWDSETPWLGLYSTLHETLAQESVVAWIIPKDV